MTSFANRDRMRDRARHITSAATAPIPLSDEFAEPWMEPSRRYEPCKSGPCAQGTRLCPSPTACQRAEPEPPTFWGSLVELLKFWR